MYSLRRNASIVCRSLQGTPANGVSVEDDMAVDRSLAFWYENRKHDSQRKFDIFADFLFHCRMLLLHHFAEVEGKSLSRLSWGVHAQATRCSTTIKHVRHSNRSAGTAG